MVFYPFELLFSKMDVFLSAFEKPHTVVLEKVLCTS